MFISYSHREANIVFPEIKKFHDAGYNVWYDQGLTPGQEWDDEIAEALMGASLLVVFISKNSMGSINVQDEIKLALNEQIDILPIYIEETELPAGLKLRLANKHALFKYLSTEEDYLKECIKTFKKAKLTVSERKEDEPKEQEPVFKKSAFKKPVSKKTPVSVKFSKLVNIKEYVHDFFDDLELYDDMRNGHNYKDFLMASLDNFIDNPNSYNAYEFYRMFFNVYDITPQDKSYYYPNFYFEASNKILDLIKLVKTHIKNYDIFPHSVNVFLLGLAIYADNDSYRNHFKEHVLNSDYRKYYKKMDGEMSHEEFFYRWGITSLLHELTYALAYLHTDNQIEFLDDVKSLLNIEGDIESIHDLSLYPVIDVNDANYIDSVKPLNILAKKISDDFGLNLSQVHQRINQLPSYFDENDITDYGYLSSMLVLHLYGSLIQGFSKDPDFFTYPVVDSVCAIFLTNTYRNFLQKEPFNLGSMECRRSPLSYLLILTKEVLYSTTGFVEFKGEFDFENYSKDASPEQARDLYAFLNMVLNLDFTRFALTSNVSDENLFGYFTEYPIKDLKSGEVPINILEMLAMESSKELNPEFRNMPPEFKLAGVKDVESCITGLNTLSYEIAPLDNPKNPVRELNPKSLEELAKWKHQKWCENKYANGWSFDQLKDNEKLTTPYLVSWEMLPREIQQYDIESSINIFKLLDKIGFKVIEDDGSSSNTLPPIEFRDYSKLFY